VETGLYVLYEIEGGEMKLSPPSAKLLAKKKLPPVSDYLRPQARFRSLPAAAAETLQQEIDARWERYRSQMT
jgi:pyruvate/2-oxoacid:ferredoxin oxidoreductase beta subunit